MPWHVAGRKEEGKNREEENKTRFLSGLCVEHFASECSVNLILNSKIVYCHLRFSTAGAHALQQEVFAWEATEGLTKISQVACPSG